MHLIVQIVLKEKLIIFLVKGLVSFFLFIFLPMLFFASDNKDLRNVRVVQVYDGDSLYVEDNSKFYPVRLAYIDAPEKGQPFSVEASFFLKKMVSHRFVLLDVVSKDKYNRIVAELFFDDLNINQAMVKNGYAWCYRHFGNSTYLNLESNARQAGLGLWAIAKPVAPWLFRKNNYRNKNYVKYKRGGKRLIVNELQQPKKLSRPRLKTKYIRFKKSL